MTSVSTFRNTGEKKYCYNWYKVNKSSLYLQKETSLLSSLRFPVILLLPCGKRGLSLFRPTLTTFFQINCAGCRKNFPSLPLLSFSFYAKGKAQVFSHTTIYFLIYSSKYF